MHWVLAVETHVLGFVERSHANHVTLKEMQAFVASERAELEQIEAYINGSGGRQARIYYIQGMLLGIVPLIALGFLAAFLISLFDALDVHDEGIRAFYGCFVAGAAGAIVSVLSRMGSKTDNFAIDHEIPRRGLYLLGSYRPIVGAIFGVAMYFLVSTDAAPDRQDDEELRLLRHGLLPRRLQRALDAGDPRRRAERDRRRAAHSPEVTDAHVPPPDRDGGADSESTVPPPAARRSSSRDRRARSSSFRRRRSSSALRHSGPPSMRSWRRRSSIATSSSARGT